MDIGDHDLSRALRLGGMAHEVLRRHARAALLAQVEHLPVSSTPSDMLAMDDLPPPAPCYVAELLDLTVEEFRGITMSPAAGAHLQKSP